MKQPVRLNGKELAFYRWGHIPSARGVGGRRGASPAGSARGRPAQAGRSLPGRLGGDEAGGGRPLPRCLRLSSGLRRSAGRLLCSAASPSASGAPLASPLRRALQIPGTAAPALPVWPRRKEEAFVSPFPPSRCPGRVAEFELALGRAVAGSTPTCVSTRVRGRATSNLCSGAHCGRLEDRAR